MNRRALLTALTLSVLPSMLIAGGWNEQGGGLLLSVGEEWGVEYLSVDAGSFDVEYRGGRGPAVRLEIYGPADERPIVERDGERLSITFPERIRIGTPVRGRIVASGPPVMDLSLTTASGGATVSTITEGVITVVTDGGRVSLEMVSGDVTVISQMGDVQLTDVTGTIGVTSHAGAILGRTVSGSLTLRTDEGRLTLWDVTGILDARTESGPIEVLGLTLAPNSRVQSNSGRVEVVFGHELEDISLDLTTESGTIHLDHEPHESPIQRGTSELEFVGVTRSGNQYYR